jgi:hypothetical protein
MEFTKHRKRIDDLSQTNVIGIERLMALVFLYSQYVFVAFYFRNLFSKIGNDAKDISTEIYVITKTIFSFLVLFFTVNADGFLCLKSILYFFSIYLMIETLVFIITPIICNYLYPQPRSYIRATILLSFNYVETMIFFALIYCYNDAIGFSNEILRVNKLLASDYIYYSFVSGVTTGIGDISPISSMGKYLTVIQVIVFLFYVMIFFNYNTNNIQSRKNL